MSEWTAEDLERLDANKEVGVASRRPDGSVRPFVTIWGVRVGDQVYIRSAHGVDNPWNVRARAAGAGRLRIGSVEWDVAFALLGADDAAQPAIDDAYHAKYDSFPAPVVASVVGDDAHATTLLVTPTD